MATAEKGPLAAWLHKNSHDDQWWTMLSSIEHSLRNSVSVCQCSNLPVYISFWYFHSNKTHGFPRNMVSTGSMPSFFIPGSAKDTPHLLSICAKAERFMAEDMLLRISYIVPWIFLGGCNKGGPKDDRMTRDSGSITNGAPRIWISSKILEACDGQTKSQKSSCLKSHRTVGKLKMPSFSNSYSTKGRTTNSYFGSQTFLPLIRSHYILICGNASHTGGSHSLNWLQK